MTPADREALMLAEERLSAIVNCSHSLDRVLTPVARRLGMKCADVQLLAQFAGLVRREVERQLAGESRPLFAASDSTIEEPLAARLEATR